MKTTMIYEMYMIPSNLRKHMARVAGLAEIIIRHWTGIPIDTASITHVCLLHDIAKPMTFDISKQKQYGLNDLEIESLVELRKHLTSAYGPNEHEAMVKIIAHVIGTDESIRIADNFEWYNLDTLLCKKDYNSLIPIYCDMRIGLNGLVSLENRVEDLRKRAPFSNMEQTLLNGKRTEEFLQPNISIPLDSIPFDMIEQNSTHSL